MRSRSAAHALPVVSPPADERDRLIRRARLLARAGLAWHGIEAAVAIGAGVAAGSLALVGFGGDSPIQGLAGGVLLWRFAATRAMSEWAEHRAHRLIAIKFYLPAAYVEVRPIRPPAA